MKNLNVKLFALVLVSIFTCSSLTAQNTDKELKKDLKSRVDKDSRKTAKDLEKDGWGVMPGKLPLERQIQESRYSELYEDNDGERMYFTATHKSLGGNYSAAKKIASSRALDELAEQVSVAVTAMVENSVSTMNFGDGDLETIDKCISASKQIVAAKLRGSESVLDIFRQNDKSCEVQVMYKMNVKKALRLYTTELKKESAELAGKLDQIIK